MPLVPVYVQILGTALICLMFLFLWQQSGILYFRYWAIAWGVQALAVCSVYLHLITGRSFWLAPYAFLQFAFALSLAAGAAAGSLRQARWKALWAFPVFLLAAYLLRLHASFDGYHALHSLLLCVIYAYTYFTLRGHAGIGGKLFRVALACLAVLALHNATVFTYLYLGRAQTWLQYARYNSVYDFALHMMLAFSAMAMWMEAQNDRMVELRAEVDRVRRESQTTIHVDRLTGLLNQTALAARTESDELFHGVVVVCDMDNFKEVNDHFGHLVGDEVLRNIGNLLRSSIRAEDEAFRWGGDEFVILFHNQNQPVVKTRMESLQTRLQGFRVRGHGVLPISFSWGIAEATGAPLRDVLDQADRAMYLRKKESGRRPGGAEAT